ncbi:transcriptional regulator LldR [Pseudoxanthomonas sp.]|uniref:transcriptional regulator LldR n=1 Tax=Pseudoxanthomonas sp. TaxID=1871049 RepID=UPI00261609BE|nr:transcriptional regulator LldR [Pseudoxanthomonas sp.]WDS35189.1 MAG: transcriptional regulator LldR [Pseudoxanthomonas sp.]
MSTIIGQTEDVGEPAPRRISDRVAAQVRALIRTRGLKAGDRLPAERALALELAVSRSALREAIAQLASQGLLVSRVGGGTYVQPAALGWQQQRIVAPLSGLMQDNPDYAFDVLEIRHALEGEAAWHAAQRATDDDRARIGASFEAMLAAHGRGDHLAEARADADFHLSIAEASHNLVLLQVMRGLFDLLQSSIRESREKLYLSPRTFESLSQQHRVLMDAIVRGDSAAARDAAQSHLRFVHDSLRALDEDQARRLRASRLPTPVDTP